jgi:hypothetical protein
VFLVRKAIQNSIEMASAASATPATVNSVPEMALFFAAEYVHRNFVTEVRVDEAKGSVHVNLMHQGADGEPSIPGLLIPAAIKSSDPKKRGEATSVSFP